MQRWAGVRERISDNWRGAAVGASLFAVGVVLGVLATGYVIGRPSPSDDAPPRVSVVVDEGTLSRSLQLPATATWPTVATVRSPAGGTVTEVARPSGYLTPGDVVLRLDERPMVVISGVIPAFRALSVGLEGRDVEAVQSYLAELGYEVDSQADAYTEITARAVRAWQESIAVPVTGTVALGDVLILEPRAFNAPLRWTDEVQAGTLLAPGTPILEQLADSPLVAIEFGGPPPAQLDEGQTGVATFPDGQREDVVLADFGSTAERQIAILEAATGTLCSRDDCLDLVAPAAETAVDVVFELVPRTTGPMVPVAAIQTDVLGRSFVELPDGTRPLVEVLVASGGSAIVRGVAAGDRILLP